jgi:hypothetical protein
MKTETPQRIHRQDYTPPPFLVDQVELDVQFHSGEVLVSSQLRLRRNPAATPGQALQLDGHGLETLSLAIDGSPARRRRLQLQRLAADHRQSAGHADTEHAGAHRCRPQHQPVGTLPLEGRLFHPVRGAGLPQDHLVPGSPGHHVALRRHPARRQGQRCRCCWPTAIRSAAATKGRPPLGALGRSLCQALLSLRARCRPPRRAARSFHHRQRSPASSSLSSSSPASSTSARMRWTRCSARCAGTKKSSDSNATSITT